MKNKTDLTWLALFFPLAFWGVMSFFLFHCPLLFWWVILPLGLFTCTPLVALPIFLFHWLMNGFV